MKANEIKPTLIKNILSEDDYEYIYKIINIALSKTNNKYENFIVHDNGMKRYVFGDNSPVIKNLIKTVKENTGYDIESAGGFFARYNKDEGGIPNLPPHFDTSGSGYGCLTFTAQLDSNIEWPIYIYDEKVELQKNEAIVFSGNSNIHWRPDIEFKEDSFLDIFVCHFFLPPTQENKLDPDHNEKMLKQRIEYTEKYKKEFNKTQNSDLGKYYTDFKPRLISNIFTPTEIEQIYKARFEDAINKKMHDGGSYTFADPSCGYITSVYPLPENIRKKLLQHVQNIALFVATEDGIHCPRYTLESGSNPQLKPHYDVGLKTAALTLSVQLKHTKPWKLYVNDDGFDLNFNEAVIFSGTHQIHWRPDIEFSQDDYYDILVCQYVPLESPLPLTDEHRAHMQKKADDYVRKYFN